MSLRARHGEERPAAVTVPAGAAAAVAGTPAASGLDRWRGPAPGARLAPIWALLVVNTWGFVGVALIVPIPRSVGQMLTMGCLACAFCLAVLRNPRLEIRPNVLLALVSVLAVLSLASGLRLEAGIGAIFRSGRLFLFVATLWLLTPWWADGLQIVRCHIRALSATLLLVLAGAVIAPGTAMSGPIDGRLQGTFWPMQPPRVGQFAAVVAGLTATLWIGRIIDGRSAMRIIPVAVAMLVLTHTRTAFTGLLVGMVFSALSLLLTSRRARRFVTWLFAGAGIGALALGPFIMNWLTRGQDTGELASLTGRQFVWSALLDQPRTLSDRVFGIGLSDKSFGGLPIDSTWLSAYHEQGYIGVVGVAALIGVLVVAAAARPPSPARACAVFLITYVIVVSYTEVGLGDAGTYLLHVFVAAALLNTHDPGVAELKEST